MKPGHGIEKFDIVMAELPLQFLCIQPLPGPVDADCGGTLHGCSPDYAGVGGLLDENAAFAVGKGHSRQQMYGLLCA
ncbi:hypothetical protein D3C76_1631760 [compost metagenome]